MGEYIEESLTKSIHSTVHFTHTCTQEFKVINQEELICENWFKDFK